MPPPTRWGEPQPGPLQRLLSRARSLVSRPDAPVAGSVPSLPLALQHGELAETYLQAAEGSDHRRAATVATAAMERAVAAGEWWAADIWGHHALWRFERAGMELAATRAARLIGDLRTSAGDPASARHYYAEAISEARDIGAEREEGLAALGMGRAAMQLSDVTVARRLAAIAVDLLERCGAPAGEVAAARELRGEEKEVGA